MSPARNDNRATDQAGSSQGGVARGPALFAVWDSESPWILKRLEQLESEMLAAIAQADDLDGLEALRVAALGRKGSLTEAMKGLGALPADQRRGAGQALNRVKPRSSKP